MRNKSINSLHELIHSLNKAEKSYFKKNRTGTRNNENVYVKLFDVVDKMEEYDERKVILKLKDFNTKQFPSIKKYLYEMIMDALVGFYREDNIEKVLERDLDKAKILFSKMLYMDAHKILVKAKDIAYKFELYEAALKIVKHQSDYLIHLTESSGLEEQLKGLYEEQQQLYELIDNESKFKYYFDSLVLTFQSRDKRMSKKELFGIIDKIVEYDDLLDDSKAITVYGKVCFHRMWFTYYSIKNDPQKAYQYIKKAYDYLKEYPFLMKVHVDAVLGVYNAMLTSTRILVKDKEFHEVINDLKGISELVGRKNDEQLIVYSQMAVYQNLIIYHLVSVNYDEVDKILPEAVVFIEKNMHKVRFDKLVSLIFNISEYYFNNEQYDESLYWWSKLANFLGKNQLQNIFDVCKVFILLCHYELETITLDNVLKSTKTYFEKQKHDHLIETAIIENVKVLSKRKMSKDEVLEAYADLKKDIAKMKVFNDENHIILDLMKNRVEAKLQGVSLKQYHINIFNENKSKLAEGVHYY